MPHFRLLILPAIVGSLAFGSGALPAREGPRPLVVTVDDLPISGGAHGDPDERRAITRGLLAALERHDIRAVGLVT